MMLKFLGVVVKSKLAKVAKVVKQRGAAVEGGLVEVEELVMELTVVAMLLAAPALPLMGLSPSARDCREVWQGRQSCTLDVLLPLFPDVSLSKVEGLLWMSVELSSSSWQWSMVLRVEELVNFFSLLKWNPFGVDVAVAMLDLRLATLSDGALELSSFDNSQRAPAGAGAF